MNSSPLHSVSVAGVVVDTMGRVLVIRRHDNHEWQAPGGVLELAESFEAGVEREVHEETGVLVRAERLTGVYKNIPRGVVALVYKCTVVGGSATPQDESDEVRWLTVDDAVARMAEAFAIRVLDAVSNSKEPRSRAHDGTNLLT